MQAMLDQIYDLVGAYVPSLVGALAILIIGWLVAVVVSKVIGGVIKRTSLDEKLSSWTESDNSSTMKFSGFVAKGVFWIIMIFVFIAFFQTLKLTIVTEPLNQLLSQIFEFAPQILGALILLLLAWVIASVLRLAVVKSLTVLKLDEKIASKSNGDKQSQVSLTKSIGDVAYWLVFLLFLPAILSSLKLDGILVPVQGMLNEILSYVPNIFTAGIILVVGLFVAKIIRQIITNLLSAVGTDKLAEKLGLKSALGSQTLSGIIGLLVYVIVLLPIIIAALNALNLDAVTTPASNMLNLILNSIPSIFAALIILALSYTIGKLLATWITSILSSLGFDNLLNKLGFDKTIENKEYSPSGIVGKVVLISIMLFAFTEAFGLLKFDLLSTLVAQFTVFGGQILLGILIFAIGLFFANLASNAIISSNTKNGNLFATVARVAILVFVGAMALRQMGIGEEIITLAFSILLGTFAVAAAIAFGIGGRDFAAKKLAQWNESIS